MIFANNKRTITVPILILYNVSIMASLRNLPLVAEFGLSMLFFFAITAIVFLIPCALVSAELATGWPKDGGIYVWVREALGDTWGFVAIWMQWVHNVAWYPAILSFIAATLAFIIEPSLADNRLYVCITVLVLFWGMTFVNYLGVETSTLLSSIGVVAGTIIPGVLIISLGVFWVVAGNPLQIDLNYSELIPSMQKIDNVTFMAGLFLAFAGLEVSASYASKVKNPQKSYPKAIIGAALITFVLFSLGSLTIAIVIPSQDISLVVGVMDTILIFLNKYGLPWMLPILGVLLVTGALAETNSWLMGPIKALHTTSKHGNLPPQLKKLNKYDMPVNLLLLQGVIVSVISMAILFLPDLSAAYWMLSAMSAQLYLLMYLLMFISAIVLRYTRPHVPRLYRIPHPHKGIWIVCIVGMIGCLFGITVAFIPPSVFPVGAIVSYEMMMLGGLVVLTAIPFIIHYFRHPSWLTSEKNGDDDA